MKKVRQNNIASDKQVSEAIRNLQKRQTQTAQIPSGSLVTDDPSKQESRPKRGRLTRKVSRRRRARRKAIMTVLLTLFVLVGLVASFFLIFRLDGFEVEGDSIYTDKELIELVPILEQENIFSFDVAETERVILEELVYIENVEVRRKLPSTVVIKVEAAVERYVVEYEKERYVLSETLKVLRLAEDGEMYTGIVGLDPKMPTVGTQIESNDENSQNMLMLLLGELSGLEIEDKVTEINLTDTLNMEIIYDGRIDVQLGSDLSMDYKIQMVTKVLTENISLNETGSIDASVPGRAVFKST